MLVHIWSVGKSFPEQELLDRGASKSYISAQPQQARNLLLMRIDPCSWNPQHLCNFHRSSEGTHFAAVGGGWAVRIFAPSHDGKPLLIGVESLGPLSTEHFNYSPRMKQLYR
jgi:hypothetical protein